MTSSREPATNSNIKPLGIEYQDKKLQVYFKAGEDTSHFTTTLKNTLQAHDLTITHHTHQGKSGEECKITYPIPFKIITISNFQKFIALLNLPNKILGSTIAVFSPNHLTAENFINDEGISLFYASKIEAELMSDLIAAKVEDDQAISWQETKGLTGQEYQVNIHLNKFDSHFKLNFIKSLISPLLINTKDKQQHWEALVDKKIAVTNSPQQSRCNMM